MTIRFRLFIQPVIAARAVLTEIPSGFACHEILFYRAHAELGCGE
jgi:hypothetical protein